MACWVHIYYRWAGLHLGGPGAFALPRLVLAPLGSEYIYIYIYIYITVLKLDYKQYIIYTVFTRLVLFKYKQQYNNNNNNNII